MPQGRTEATGSRRSNGFGGIVDAVKPVTVVWHKLGKWLGLLALCLAAACDDAPVAELTVALDPWPSNDLLRLANVRNYFGSDTIRMVDLLSPSQTARAFRNRQVDVAMLTLDESLLMIQDGFDVRAVIVADFSNGADAIIGRPGIGGIADLVGRRVGADSLGPGAFLLSRALELNRVDPSQITVVPVSVDAQRQMFREGKVDAMVVAEPVLSDLLGEGAKELFDSSQIPGEIVDLMVVRGEVAVTKRRHLRRLVEGWNRVLGDLAKDRRAVAAAAGGIQGVTTDYFLQSISQLHFPDRDENRSLLDASGTGLPATAAKLSEILVRQNFLRAPVDLAPMFDRSMIDFLLAP